MKTLTKEKHYKTKQIELLYPNVVLIKTDIREPFKTYMKGYTVDGYRKRELDGFYDNLDLIEVK